MNATIAPATTTTRRLGPWLVVAVGFLALSLAFSARAALSLAMPTWAQDPGWPRGFVSTAGALALIVMAGVSPFAGNLVDRHGPRWLLGAGMAAVGGGMLAIALADSRWVFLVAYSGLSAVGFGFVATHVVATAIARRFEERRGLAIGIGTAGATGGQLAIVPLLALLLQAGRWRAGFVGLGLAGFLLAAIAVFALGGRRPAANHADSHAARHAAEPLAARLGYLLRSPVFHLLFWSYLICGFTTTGAIETHLLPYAASCGFPPLPSAGAYGLLSALNLLGMVGAGWLVDRVNRPVMLAAIYLARAACFLLLLFVAGRLPLLLLFSILFGLFDYSTVPATASLVASHLGLRVMGLAMGLISAGHSAGAAAGAFLGGWLFDRLHRYDELWLASLALAVAAGLAVLLIPQSAGGREPDAAAAPAG